MNFILASQSVYRRQLIEKMGIPFTCVRPLISEEEVKLNLLQNKLSPQSLAEELSLQKGLSVLNSLTDRNLAIILAGDQLVEFEDEIIGKPLNYENAFNQLKKMQNKSHRLITSVTLLSSQKIQNYTEITQLKMHPLSDNEIANYLKKDLPYDCAGSYKIEQQGIALFESIKTDDFTAIQGIPLIWLSKRLKEYNYEFFQS